MAKLTAAERKKLKPKEFLGPDRTFPGEDRSHLKAAIRDAPRAEHAGSITHREERRIVNKAESKLHARKLSHRLGVLPRRKSR